MSSVSSGYQTKPSKQPSPLPIFLSIFLPLVLYGILIAFQNYDPNLMFIKGHFYVVSATSLLAGVMAIIVGIIGTKLRNIQVILVALAFVSLSLVFAMHGLATPGFILPKNRLGGVTAHLSVLLTSYWLFLSSLPSTSRTIRRLAKWSPYLIVTWTSLIVALGVLFFLNPSLANYLPIDSNPVKLFSTFIGMELFVITGWQYWRSYRYTHSPLQLALVYGSGWLAVSMIIMSTSVLWHSSWWIYHLLMIFATAFMVVGVAREYLKGSSIAAVLQGIWNEDPLERLKAAISPAVRQLIIQTEAHDSYTAGHNERVATMAVQLGKSMGLTPEELRALAQGGIVHDIGKLNIPSEILNKPGKLDDAERKLIEEHPKNGWKLCKAIGFMPAELAVIRHHHEKWDGTGYPDKLSGEDIPLLARIMAVADVYDALTSKRSYRDPWSHTQASNFLIAQQGSQFCPTVIEAWEAMLKEEALIDAVRAKNTDAGQIEAVSI